MGGLLSSDFWGAWRARAYMLPLILAAVLTALLLIRLPLLEAAVLLSVAAVVVAAFFEPLVGIGAALFAGPLRAWLSAELPHIPPQIGQYLFVLTVGLWAVRGLLRRDLRLPLPPLTFPLALFLSVGLLSLWSAADPWAGFLELGKWAQLALCFIITYERIARPGVQQVTSALLGLLAGVAVIQAGMGLWQHFGYYEAAPDHFMIAAGRYRAYGTFEQPNPFGGFLGMMAALLAGVVIVSAWDCWKARRWPSQWLWPLAGALLVTGAGLYASWSRGAWMGFGAALLVIAALLPRRGLWGVIVVALVIVIGLGFYSAGRLPEAIAHRLTGFLDYTRFEDVRGVGINEANYAVIERMAHWQAALEMWRENFWLGVGLGCYEPAYAAYSLINWPLGLGHAHNYYLTLLAETGLLGLVAYLGFLGALGVQLWRASRVLEGWPRALALGLGGAWTHFAVHDLVDNLLVNNVHLHVGVLLALTAWLIALRRQQTTVAVSSAGLCARF